MLHRIFNLRNIYGSIAFISMICVPGAAEAEKYVTSVIFIIMIWVFAMLAMREDEKKENRPNTP